LEPGPFIEKSISLEISQVSSIPDARRKRLRCIIILETLWNKADGMLVACPKGEIVWFYFYGLRVTKCHLNSCLKNTIIDNIVLY